MLISTNMPFSDKIIRISFIVLLCLGLVGVIWATVANNSHKAELIRLQNELASRDATIETQKGVFQKLTLQSENLQSLLDQKDEQVKSLVAQLKKNGSELLTATTLIIQLRKELQSAGNATQTEPELGSTLVKVNFSSGDDFAPFLVEGWTLGDSARKVQPTANMKMSQLRPLKLNVLVSQDKTGIWKTSTTSSEENLQVDIKLAGVNPYVLAPKWYEKIGISLDLGIATGPNFLGGVGASYEIGKFELGPKVWIFAGSSGIHPVFGANLLWHPFKK